ncbi:MAG: PQQ-binding-like beta-propeller repeat protein [bacterium]
MNRNLRLIHAERSVIALSGIVALTAFSVARPAVADDWSQLRGDVTRRGVSSEKITTPLSLLWRFSAGAQTQNPSAPVVVGDTAYYAARGTGEGGVLYALDINTGARKWQFPWDPNGLPNKTLFTSAPMVSNGVIYVGHPMVVSTALMQRPVRKSLPSRQVEPLPRPQLWWITPFILALTMATSTCWTPKPALLSGRPTGIKRETLISTRRVPALFPLRS